jgi:Fe-S-cluster-containing hydrogenase component 2
MERQLVVDVDKCTGCRMCEMACSLEKEGECGRIYSRIKVIKMENGTDVPIVCLQCEDAVCEDVCPAHAISKNMNGTIIINYEMCVGCKMCLSLCPLGAISLDQKRKVVKCDLCGGEPKCVMFCQPKALMFTKKNKIDTIKRRSYAEKIYLHEHGRPLVEGKLKV